MADPSLDAWDELRQWLRYNPTWTATVNPWGLYGCVEITLYRDGDQRFYDRGFSLGKRCINAIAHMRTWADIVQPPHPHRSSG